MGYPKDRVNRSKAMPPNLVTLFAHVMSRANEGIRGSGSRAHSWDEVLQPASSAGSTSPGPFPMSAQDWRKAEAFSVQLQSLLATRQSRCTPNGHSRTAGHYANGVASACSSPSAAASAHSDEGVASQTESSSATSTIASSEGKSVSQANGKVKGRAKPTAMHAAHGGASDAPPAASSAASPNPGASWPRHHAPRVTPKEPNRAGEPSAPTKVVGRVAASRRVNGSADGAVASLEVSNPVPGAFETPSHPSHIAAPPGAPAGGNPRGRDTSPSRYPARLRSRRFPQLGGTGESPELPQPRGLGQGGGADNVEEVDQAHGARRLSPRNSHSSLARGELPQDWLGVARAGASAHEHGHDVRGGGSDQRDGVTTRAAPKAAHDLEPAKGVLSGTYTSQADAGTVVSPAKMDFRPAPPPIMSSTAAFDESNPKPEVTARPRQVLHGGRSVGRATPVPRSSVGGRNYTDNQVKQLGLIEAAVVSSATAKDRAMYNLPRQGRTLTLTNVFKFVALRGAGAMYRFATEKQIEAHTGRHSNFFDGKIDARIVSTIRKDIDDETITKSRKFSKVLLSLVAEGCNHPDCDWDHNSFTSENIANLQARLEAETGTSALQFCSDTLSPDGTSTSGADAAASATAAAAPLSPLGPSNLTGAGASGGQSNGAPSKRRLDLGRDGGQTPSPSVKRLRRDSRARSMGVESTPTAGGRGSGSSKSPPKEEDDMRAAEVLQGLKGVGAPSG